MKQIRPFPVFLCLLILLLSCRNQKEETVIEPPPTNPLSRGIIGYGVVNVPYIHLEEEPPENEAGKAPESGGYLRRGAIVKVLERRSFTVPWSSSRPVSWVYVEGSAPGWLPESALDIYDNESRARTAQEAMSP